MIKNLPTKYVEFIEECKMKQYETNHTHKHHILPRFMGGSDDVSNLVELSVSDHFEAHKLLAENVDEEYKVGTWSSLHLLKKYWSGDYEEIRSKISEALSGENNPMSGRVFTDDERKRMSEIQLGEKNHFYGKHHTEETKRKISEKSKKWLNENGSPFKGKTHTIENRKKLSELAKKQFKEKGHPSNRKCMDVETNTIYDSIKEMAQSIGVPRTTMNRWVKDNRKTQFKYIENE